MAMAPLRLRGIERVRLHADLTGFDETRVPSGFGERWQLRRNSCRAAAYRSASKQAGGALIGRARLGENDPLVCKKLNGPATCGSESNTSLT